MRTSRRRPGQRLDLGSVLVAIVLATLGSCDQDSGQTNGSSGAQQNPPATPDPLVEIREHPLEEGETLESLASSNEDGTPALVRSVIRNEDGVINHGRFQKWHPNAQLAEEGHYLRGQKHGTYTVIAESGLKKTEIEFRHGKRHGQYLKWRQRGVLKERSHYHEGLLHGSFEQWNGLIRSVQGTYEHGRETGPWTYWHMLEESVVSSQGEFLEGRKHGLWKNWNEAGSPTTEETFTQGEWDGPFREYAETGDLAVERTYAAGRPDGLQVEWHPGGQKKSESRYVEGRLDGPQEHWFQNGQLRMKGSVKDGKRLGRWVYYNADGTVNESWTGTYENDQRIGE